MDKINGTGILTPEQALDLCQTPAWGDWSGAIDLLHTSHEVLHERLKTTQALLVDAMQTADSLRADLAAALKERDDVADWLRIELVVATRRNDLLRHDLFAELLARLSPVEKM
jgi:hypothetical protein